MRTRFTLLPALAAALLLTFGAGPALGAIGDVETPTVEGPVPTTADSTPWAATDKQLGSYGYVEREYEYSGKAFAYDTSGDIDQDGSKITTGGDGSGRHDYKTRMIVRRPADAADFNGTVVVEWQNVTAQFDLEANWFGDPEYLLENGYAYVAISAQRVGVNALKLWDSDRYGDLDVTGGGALTGDELSYEIFSAGVKALLDGGTGVDPLGPLAKPETVIASGESQSGSRLRTYYNKIQPLHEIVDAFLLTVSSSEVRDDGAVPVIRILSETENRTPRTEPDTAMYRHWEVAGGSHLPRMAYDNFQAPIERDLGLTLAADCEEYPLSRVQWPFVVNSAYEHLVAWANGGAAPPIAPRGSYDPTPADPSDQLVRDELGIAQGGIRLPEMSVPARLNTGINAQAGGGLFSLFCGLLGSTADLSDEVLLARYDDWADYVAQVTAEANALAGQGFILDQDVPRLIQMHREVPNLRPTEPKRSGAKARNKGKFTLTWEGTEAPLSTFELQQSRNGGKTWKPVKGAGELDDPVYRFAGKKRAKDGKWRYRTRSNTTVPADAIREEFVVTTPWSETSKKVTVDRTKPKLRLRCPRKVEKGEKAFVRIKASDAGVGLRKDPSGKKRIKTKRTGKRKIKAKAVDKLGNKRKKSCKVRVVKR